MLDEAEWRAREEPLWRSETRYDPAYMGRVLHPEFLEFGRSGRTYDGAACLAAEPREIRATLPHRDFAVSALSPEVVLVTYVSEAVYDELEVTNRASVWVRLDGDWRLRFHQGTPRTRG